ncbi:unnamed protein product [Rhizophagus irregularis]|nr:unnamed protein product [Rhizophagus irregularis]
MEQEINIRNEDDTVSNNDEESLINSSLQVPRSDVEKNLFANKVRDMMNNGYSFGNDKIVDESIDTIHNNNVRNSYIDEQNDIYNSEDDDTNDSQVKNYDDIPSTSGHNRIDKEKEFESYYREQKDEFTRRPNYQDSDDDSTDGETKKQISKSRYAVRNRRETSDDDNSNDDNDHDDNIGDNQVKNDDYYEDVIPSSSGHNRIDKKKEFESYYREQKDEFTRRQKIKTVKNDDYYEDDIPSSSGHNRIDKKKEFESYYREQKDEFTRRQKNQDGSDDSTDEETKKQISKSRYAVRNRRETSDDDNSNDDNDHDDNIGDNQVKNDDYYEDVIPSSPGHNRIDKKKEFESYYREQKDEFTRRQKNQDGSDDSTDEETKKQISKSRYAVRNRRETSDDDNSNDDNDHDDNIGDNQVKNDDYYEDVIPSSPGHNRIDKKKEFESYYREQKDEFTRRQKNQDGSDDSTDEETKKQISKSRYAVGNRKMSDDENEDANDDKEPEFYGEQMDETTRDPKNKNGQNLSIHGGNQKKLDNTSDSSQDENDDYEEQIDETNRYPYNKNGQNLKKLDNMSDSSQDENDDYEEQMDETIEYPNNKNSQNLPIHGGNRRKLGNISDSSQDENDDYEEQMDETTRYPRYPKDKNNQNLSMHGGNQKKLDNNSDSSQDENDEYKDSDFLPSGRANKKKNGSLIMKNK